MSEAEFPFAPEPELEPGPDSDSSPPPPGPVPYWNYQDLLIFALLALPTLGLATLAVGLIAGVTQGPGVKKALIILPAQFLGYALWFGSLYLLLKTRYNRPFWKSLGWSVPDHGLGRYLILGPVLALAVGIVGAVLRTPPLNLPIEDLLKDRLSVFLVGLFAVTFGPFCEELAFRGFALPLVTRTLGALPAILLVGVAFAMLHGPQHGWRYILLLSLAGAAFGWARHRSGSTVAAVALHSTYNLTYFAMFILQSKDFPSPW